MKPVEVTDALLADLTKKAENVLRAQNKWEFPETDVGAAFYAAAHPRAVLALVAAVRRLRSERQEAVDALYQWVYGVKYEDRDEVANALSQAVEIARREDGKA